MNAATATPTPTLTKHTLHVLRAMLLSLSLIATAACGDSPMAPQPSIDRAAAAHVAPAVRDSRVRLALGVENVAVRARITHDLQELEDALRNADGQKARFHVRVLGTVIADYRREQRALTTDGADVTGIVLMLHAVSRVVDAGFDMSLSL